MSFGKKLQEILPFKRLCLLFLISCLVLSGVLWYSFNDAKVIATTPVNSVHPTGSGFGHGNVTNPTYSLNNKSFIAKEQLMASRAAVRHRT